MSLKAAVTWTLNFLRQVFYVYLHLKRYANPEHYDYGKVLSLNRCLMSYPSWTIYFLHLLLLSCAVLEAGYLEVVYSGKMMVPPMFFLMPF